MPTSIRELILDEIVTTLKTVAPPAYDVAEDLKDVRRVTANPWDEPIYPLVHVIDLGEDSTDGQPAQRTTCLLQVEIQFWHDRWTQVSTEAGRYLAAIKKALYVDTTRGGKAYDTDIVRSQLILAEETMPLNGGQVTAVIHYRHILGDPYTIG